AVLGSLDEEGPPTGNTDRPGGEAIDRIELDLGHGRCPLVSLGKPYRARAFARDLPAGDVAGEDGDVGGPVHQAGADDSGEGPSAVAGGRRGRRQERIRLRDMGCRSVRGPGPWRERALPFKGRPPD